MSERERDKERDKKPLPPKIRHKGQGDRSREEDSHGNSAVVLGDEKRGEEPSGRNRERARRVKSRRPNLTVDLSAASHRDSGSVKRRRLARKLRGVAPIGASHEATRSSLRRVTRRCVIQASLASRASDRARSYGLRKPTRTASRDGRDASLTRYLRETSVYARRIKART